MSTPMHLGMPTPSFYHHSLQQLNMLAKEKVKIALLMGIPSCLLLLLALKLDLVLGMLFMVQRC